MNKHITNIHPQVIVIDKKKQQLKIIVLLIVSLSPLYSAAQQFSNPVRTINEKKEFIYGIDNRRTHIKEHSTLIYGVYMGVVFGDKLRFKAGVSGTPFEKGKFIDEQGILRKNKLLFINLGEEFDFLIINKFRLTAYLQTGVGYNYYRKINALGNEVEKGKYLIIPIETGIHANYDILPWLRIKLGGGWRFVLPDYSYDLSGYYIKTGLSINIKKLKEVYRFKRDEKQIKL